MKDKASVRAVIELARSEQVRDMIAEFDALIDTAYQQSGEQRETAARRVTELLPGGQAEALAELERAHGASRVDLISVAFVCGVMAANRKTPSGSAPTQASRCDPMPVESGEFSSIGTLPGAPAGAPKDAKLDELFQMSLDGRQDAEYENLIHKLGMDAWQQRIQRIRQMFEELDLYPGAEHEANFLTNKGWQRRIMESLKKHVDDLEPEDVWPLYDLFDRLTRVSPRRLRRLAGIEKREAKREAKQQRTTKR
jgi:hypothetical protein